MSTYLFNANNKNELHFPLACHSIRPPSGLETLPLDRAFVDDTHSGGGRPKAY